MSTMRTPPRPTGRFDMNDIDCGFVIYHPEAGFLVDTDGAWNTDRDQACCFHDDHEVAEAFKVLRKNGYGDVDFLIYCQKLTWWTRKPKPLGG